MEEFENEKHTCNCSKTEKILYLTVLTNTITSLALAVVALVLVFKMFTPPAFIHGQRPQPRMEIQKDWQEMPALEEKQARQNKKEVKEPKHLFEKGLFGNNFKSFSESKQSDKKMLVLFYADWCPHCQRFSPTFEKLSKDRDLKKSFNFVPLNSEAPETRTVMEEYQVQGFPALFIVNNQTGQKTFIPNNLLFDDNAVQNLKDIALRIK